MHGFQKNIFLQSKLFFPFAHELVKGPSQDPLSELMDKLRTNTWILVPSLFFAYFSHGALRPRWFSFAFSASLCIFHHEWALMGKQRIILTTQRLDSLHGIFCTSVGTKETVSRSFSSLEPALQAYQHPVQT